MLLNMVMFKVTICDLKNKDRNMADNIEHQDKGELVANCDLKRRMRTTFEIQPYVFTENGVAMLSSVLRSDTAIEVNIRIMRAFVSMRHFMVNNASMFSRLETIEYHQLEISRKRT